MWISILNMISSIANLPGSPGPTPGSNEIVTEGVQENIISQDNQELIIE
jgi:hypothetical protein